MSKVAKILKNLIPKKETKSNTTNAVTTSKDTKQVRSSASGGSKISALKTFLYKYNPSKTNKPQGANEKLLSEKLDNKDITTNKPLDKCEC